MLWSFLVPVWLNDDKHGKRPLMLLMHFWKALKPSLLLEEKWAWSVINWFKRVLYLLPSKIETSYMWKSNSLIFQFWCFVNYIYCQLYGTIFIDWYSNLKIVGANWWWWLHNNKEIWKKKPLRVMVLRKRRNKKSQQFSRMCVKH